MLPHSHALSQNSFVQEETQINRPQV